MTNDEAEKRPEPSRKRSVAAALAVLALVAGMGLSACDEADDDVGVEQEDDD